MIFKDRICSGACDILQYRNPKNIVFSIAETSGGHKNSDCSESAENSWERVDSKRSRRKRKVNHKKNIVKDEDRGSRKAKDLENKEPIIESADVEMKNDPQPEVCLNILSIFL